MFILAIFAIHLFVTFLVAITLYTFDFIEYQNENDTAIARIAFSFFWEITAPITLVIIFFTCAFAVLPEIISNKIKELVKTRKEKREALNKIREEEDKREKLLRYNLSKDVNGESSSFRSSPKIVKSPH
jgi:predicted membrane protein